MPSGHLASIASVLVYAFGLIWQKILAVEHAVYVVAFWQFFIAAIVLWIVTLAIDGRRGFSLVYVVAPLAWGVMAPGSSLMLGMVASRMTDGVSMMLIWALLPFVAPLVSPFLIGERLRLDILAGAGIAFAGVALGTMTRHAEGWTTVEGLLLTGLAVVMAGLGYVLGRFLNRNGGNWRRTAALQVSGAALAALGFGLFAADGSLVAPSFAWPDQTLIMLYLILVMSVANFLLFNYALAKIPVAFVSIYSALSSVFGAIAAWLLLGDQLRVVDYATFVIVVFGVALPNLIQIRRTRALAKAAGRATTAKSLPDQ